MNIETTIPTRSQTLIFRGKATLLQSKRAFENLLDFDLKRFSPLADLSDLPIIAESKTPLRTESAAAEQSLLAGKVHNLRLAIKKINNLEIPAGAVFSFWKHVGRASRRKGYVAGRELREGCIIPTLGGGLCQLSNALYDAALRANFEIVERRAHTEIVAGSLAEQGRDATVFWNYIDLRFRSARAFRIEAKLGKDHLTVRFRSDAKRQNFVSLKRGKTANSPAAQNLPLSAQPNSCATCGVESCFRSLKPEVNLDFGRAAFLLDEFSPEFDEYIQAAKSGKDFLFVPLDGARFKKANYAWTLDGFAQTNQSFFIALLRSYKSRKLAAQGAARQTNLLAMYEKLAASYAKNLTFDATHLVVQQNLLPFLWRAGILGGRTFDVLMTALPLKDLQKHLDFAASLHPQSKTLGDFRADVSLVEAEAEALENARKIITPHAAIAALFGERAEILQWKIPQMNEFKKRKNEKYTIVFPASTVGRKGCYELREAVENLDVKIITLGARVEGENFWSGFDVEKGNPNWLEAADLVVLPAFVEHKPRRLLEAVARGVPVIASENCGVENVAGVKTIEAGDRVSLRNEIERFLRGFQK